MSDHLDRPQTVYDERFAREHGLWRPLKTGMTTMERAWHVEQRYQRSWWDALIVARAQASGCRYLLTEVLQHGPDLDGLLVCSPFRAPPDTPLGTPPPRTAHTGSCLTLTAVHPSTPRSCRSR